MTTATTTTAEAARGRRPEDAIPGNALAGISNWIRYGDAGGFITAVMRNDLFAAAGHADDGNRAALAAVALYTGNFIPTCCCGSPDAVERWAAESQATRARIWQNWMGSRGLVESPGGAPVAKGGA